MSNETQTPAALIGETIDGLRDGEKNLSIVEYTRTESALAAMEEEYRGVVYDVTDPEQMKTAKAARKRLVTLRTSLEKKRVELKRPVLDFTKALDGQAKTITARIKKLEDPIDEQIKAEEQRQERERIAHEEAERQRLGAIRERIETLRSAPSRHLQAAPAAIEAAMDELMADPLEGFAELEREAAIVRDEAVAKLFDTLTLAKQREAERAELEELRQFKEQQLKAQEEAKRREAEQEADRRREEEKAQAAQQREDTAAARGYGGSGIPVNKMVIDHRDHAAVTPEPAHVGFDPGAGDERSVEATVAPATRSPVLDGFLGKYGKAAKPAAEEHEFDVDVEWSGYCRGHATYRVTAATAAEAMERWSDGERIARTIVRDDTESEPVSAMLTEIATHEEA